MNFQHLIQPTEMPPPEYIDGKKILYPESDGRPIAETQKHIRTITRMLESLDAYFAPEADVNVFANIMFYYEEENPKKCVSPDVFVVKGIDKTPRRIFKLWAENVPVVVFEISSRGTWSDDLTRKFKLYEQFGVKEYYIYDPEYASLPEPLIAFRLNEKSEFVKQNVENNWIHSDALSLEIVDNGETLRFFNPVTQLYLSTLAEAEFEKSILEQQNETITNENERLKAEIARLQSLMNAEK